MDDKMEEFPCRHYTFLRCGNPMFRFNIGDAIDYPFCESCQKDIMEEITRLDNGLFPNENDCWGRG